MCLNKSGKYYKYQCMSFSCLHFSTGQQTQECKMARGLKRSKHKVEACTVLLVFLNILATCPPVFVNQKKASEVDNSPFRGRNLFSASVCQYNFFGGVLCCLHSCDKCLIPNE